MNIDKAKTLKPGMKVNCPEDSGNKGYQGTVVGVGTEVNTSFHGWEYVWVEVKCPCGSKTVWPSNRLS